jgi:hypothetical protein
VTLVIPGTLVRPSLAIDLRAFFSLREWTIVPPAGRPLSPVSTSESELSDPSSSAVTFFVGSSSGSSSIRGFDMLGGASAMANVSRLTLCGHYLLEFRNSVVCAEPRRIRGSHWILNFESGCNKIQRELTERYGS